MLVCLGHACSIQTPDSAERSQDSESAVREHEDLQVCEQHWHTFSVHPESRKHCAGCPISSTLSIMYRIETPARFAEEPYTQGTLKTAASMAGSELEPKSAFVFSVLGE